MSSILDSVSIIEQTIIERASRKLINLKLQTFQML